MIVVLAIYETGITQGLVIGIVVLMMYCCEAHKPRYCDHRINILWMHGQRRASLLVLHNVERLKEGVFSKLKVRIYRIYLRYLCSRIFRSSYFLKGNFG